jgi:hypothetical protein
MNTLHIAYIVCGANCASADVEFASDIFLIGDGRRCRRAFPIAG